MSKSTFLDGNGVRHASLMRLINVPRHLFRRRVAIQSMCRREFAVALDEVRDDEPASCMTCLVHEAREPGP